MNENLYHVSMQAHALSVIWLPSQPWSSQQAILRQTDGSPRRNAFWASWVMASASSRITSLKPFLGIKERKSRLEVSGRKFQRRTMRARAVPTHLKMVLVLAKLRMGPRTTSIPLSSEAFSYKTKRGWNHDAQGSENSCRRRSYVEVCGVPLAPWSWTPCPCTAA